MLVVAPALLRSRLHRPRIHGLPRTLKPERIVTLREPGLQAPKPPDRTATEATDSAAAAPCVVTANGSAAPRAHHARHPSREMVEAPPATPSLEPSRNWELAVAWEGAP